MVMLLLIMFNLLIQKAKKIIENKRISELDANTSSISASRFAQKMSGKEIDDVELKETIYDIIKTIKDPEKPATLEELNVVQEDDIYIVQPIEANGTKIVRVEFTPTVPHCSLATLIGLCIRVKLQRTLLQKVKVDIIVKEGSHSTENEINKQVNDKERVAAAMENPNLLQIVEKCIEEME